MNQTVRYLLGNIHPCEYPIVGHFGHSLVPWTKSWPKWGYKQFRSKTMRLMAKNVPLWKCDILDPQKNKIGFNNHSPVQKWSLVKKSVFGRVNFLVLFFAKRANVEKTAPNYLGKPLHPWANVGKKCSKPFWQAFASLSGNAHTETTHFKKGLPLVWHPIHQLL